MKNKSLEVLEKIVNLNSFNRKDLIELSSRQDVIELLDDILGSILS